MSARTAVFEASLMALGDPAEIDMADLSNDRTGALVFVASIDEMRKAGCLYRDPVKLHAGPLYEAAPDMLAALGLCEDALNLASTPLPEDRQVVLTAQRAALAAIAKARGGR